MDRFLIESPHTQGDCKKVVKDVYAEGYLYNFDWGCGDGVHKAWVTIEAEDAKQALRSVPYTLRANATATKLMKFDAKTVEEWKVD